VLMAVYCKHGHESFLCIAQCMHSMIAKAEFIQFKIHYIRPKILYTLTFPLQLEVCIRSDVFILVMKTSDGSQNIKVYIIFKLCVMNFNLIDQINLFAVIKAEFI